jgi:SsrA-binding protein
MSLIRNKKAHLDYAFLETFEAGLELLGIEVKSLRAGRGNLEGARVVARGGEAYLVGATIPPYQAGNTPEDYDSERTRRLLLSKNEVAQISSAESARGLTIVPISVYNKGRNLKLEIAIARGKKQYDKRQDLKKRDAERSFKRKEF